MTYGTVAIWAGAAVVAAPIFLWLLSNFNDWYYCSKENLPLGSMGWPLVGETLTFTKCFSTNKPNWFIGRLVSKYGKKSAYKSHLFGSPAIILTSQEFNKFACSRLDLFDPGWPSGKTLMGESALVMSTGEKHKKLRTHFMTSIGGVKSIASAIPKIEVAIKAALARWADGKPFGLREAVKKLAFEHIADVFMSISKPEEVERLAFAYRIMMKGFRSFPLMIPGSKFYNAVQSKRKLSQMIQDAIDERRAKKTGKQYDDLLQNMIDSRDENGILLEDEEIKDNLTSFFLAAHESTAVTILWSCIYLSRNPQYVKDLKEEYDWATETKEGETFTLNELAKFKFTRKVVDETLRVTNVSPMIMRKATADIEFNGVTFPKGWRTMIWIRAQHLDPNYYENPLEFNPRRWEGDNYEKAKANFMAFGVGGRTCPGIGLARMKISLFLYYLVSNYKWEFVNPNAPLTHLPHPVPLDGAQVKITPLSKLT